MKIATAASFSVLLLFARSAFAAPTDAPAPLPESSPDVAPPASDTDPNADDTGPTPLDAPPQPGNADTPDGAPSPQTVAQPAASAEAKASSDTLPDDDIDWYQELDLDAFLSASYMHNFGFTNPAGINIGRLFDRNNDSFKLDLATVTLQWKPHLPGDAGFRLDISHGIVVPVVLGGVDVAVLQAYARYIIPVGSGLTLDLGSFLSHIGSETVEGYETTNATYSHGFIFSLFTPATFSGLRLSYNFAHVAQATFWLVNGWGANTFDNNAAKTLGLQLNIAPNEMWRLNVSYLAGAEKAGDNHDWRQSLNAYFEVHPSSIFLARLEASYGHESNTGLGSSATPAGPATQWWALGAVVRAQIDVFGLAARFEYADNSDGFANLEAKMIEWTVSPSVRIHEAFLLRADLRQDFALGGARLFNGAAANAFTAPGSTRQTTLALNAVLAY